jgi:transcriptional regulator with XRE-family HTH domain
MTREIDPKLADTPAARMLAEGLSRASQERGLSMRKVGALLGYKQAVVLSHMTTGRVPIPIDRAEDIARVLGIDPKAFLQAVVKQRHPDVSWSLLSNEDGQEGDELTHELAVSLGMPLKELNQEQRAVMREVAADPRPRRRWLSVHELTAIEAFREVRPAVQSEGLSALDLSRIRDALRGNKES